MMRHEEWFSYLEKPKKQGVVETGDNTPHTIKHVGEVPLNYFGQERETHERVIRPDKNEEPGVGWTDHRLGDASSIHESQVLHQRRGQSHCTRAPKMEDVHS